MVVLPAHLVLSFVSEYHQFRDLFSTVSFCVLKMSILIFFFNFPDNNAVKRGRCDFLICESNVIHFGNALWII